MSAKDKSTIYRMNEENLRVLLFLCSIGLMLLTVLNAVHANGMFGVVDLILKGERDGMDWDNDAMVKAQAETTLATV